MNKAFMKEPEAPAPRCPAAKGCGSLGLPVSPDTLAAQLTAEETASFSSAAFYCPNPDCAIAYYDDWGHTVPVASLRAGVYPKDPGGPICACLEITADQIIEDARRGDRTRVLAIIEQARREDADCVRHSPEGCSCEKRVRRLFLQHFAEKSGA